MVYLDARDGLPRRRMEWVKPIEELERDFRVSGFFLLVDTDGQLKMSGGRDGSPARDALVGELRGRTREMIDLLVTRSRARSEVR